MYKNKQIKNILAILVVLMGILSFKLIVVKNKFIRINNQDVLTVTKEKKLKNVEKYGYSDILESLSKNGDYIVESINMLENEKCNVQVNYKGDIKLLYSSLYSLSESKNFLCINSISINKDVKVTNISINFKKSK